MKKNTIFIQIAAYRDSELLPTIRDCIKNAKRPENLRFCIGWQHGPEDEWDTLDEFKNDERFTIIDIHYRQTRGVCWIRSEIQKRWDGEEYTLHLDSHHRFEKNWDTTLIKMIKDLQKAGHKKPVLTAYVPSYTPANDPDGRAKEPWWMTFDRFTPEGAVFFIPAIIPNWQKRKLPYPGRFFSAHFAFTLGKFCIDVPHDPKYLFHGEEISIAARAFTKGYELFAPHKVVVWHEYSRNYRPRKSWDDLPQWWMWDKDSLTRNRKLFGMDGLERDNESFGIYGFGTEKTLEEYEQYAGIKFSTRSVQQYTLDNHAPPNPKFKKKEEYERSFLRVFKHCIDVPFTSAPHTDYDVWAVAFEDEHGNEITRLDATPDEITRMRQDIDGYYKVWRTFHTSTQPKKWIIWPHSKEHGWGERLEGNI